MPGGPRIIVENACYHLIARGNQKQKIFRERKDYEEYLDRLKRYKREFGFSLYGYCLMPNHIHMLGEIKPASQLSHFMASLLRSYTAYFNEKYGKEGHLWQGRFKSRVITKDRYLIDCLSYIELNPVRADMVNTPYEYHWSSYNERVGEEKVEIGLLSNLIL